MSGQIKKMIDSILEQRAKGNALLVTVTKTKLIPKGADGEPFVRSPNSATPGRKSLPPIREHL